MSSNEECTAVSRQQQSDEEQGEVVAGPGLQILLQVASGAEDNWHRAKRIHRSMLEEKYGNMGRFRVSSGNIAAIDFGTTFCSLAFTTPGGGINTVKLDDKHPRVPSAILLKKNVPSSSATGPGAKTSSYEVMSFGYAAQEKHSNLRSKERTNYLYFERFKMTLQHDKNVNRVMTVNASNGERYYMVEVIAFILCYLKKVLVKRLSRTFGTLKAKDFDWVVTVPAIWRARGKRMMREAAYMAGLCSGENGIDCFTSTEVAVPRPTETNPDRLTLALEPEAAAIYCRGRKENETASHCFFSGPMKSDHYLVVDIGGGTVDITAHQHDGKVGGIRVIVPPTGNDCGGTQVNQEFSKLLQTIFNDKETENSIAFSKFLQNGEKASRQVIINDLIFREFEQQKLIFGENASGFGDEDPDTDEEEICVTLHREVIETYGLQNIKAQIAAIPGNSVEIEEGKLRIKYFKVRELFQPAVDGILGCTRSVLAEMKTQVDTVYLVGGFGGCKYIYEKINSLVEAHFPQAFHVIVPLSNELAVAQGAVEYRRNPEIIRSRKMDASYGIEINPVYDSDIHDEAYVYESDQDGENRVSNVFLQYVRKNEVISADEVVTQEFTVINNNDTSMCLPIYSSFLEDVKYVENSDGTPKPDVRRIGELIVEMPNDANLTRDQRPVELTMDFAHTEIQVRARYLVLGHDSTEVKAIADFLSEQTEDKS